MGMVHASRGRLEPASPHLLSEPAIVAPPRPRASSATDSTHAVGGVREGLRHHPRPHRPRGPRLRGLQRARGRTPAASPSRTPRATSAASPPPPARPTSPPRPSSTPTCPRAGCCCRPCARTTSTTPRSTASTTATAASGTAAASSSSTPTTPRALGLADGSYADLVSEWKDGAERRAPRLPRRALPDRPRLRRRLLPGDQRPGPARRHRRHQQHPRQQVRRRPSGTIGYRLSVRSAT